MARKQQKRPSNYKKPSRPVVTKPKVDPSNVPPPSQGPGILGGVLGTVAQGFSFGTGSALAHQGINSIFSGSEKATPPQAETEPPTPCPSTTDANIKNICKSIFYQYQQCLLSDPHSDECQKYGQQVKQCLELS